MMENEPNLNPYLLRFLRMQSDSHFGSFLAHYFWFKKNSKISDIFHKFIRACPKRPVRVLDIGFGDGNLLFRLARESKGKDIRLHGIDIDYANVAFVKKAAELEGLSGIMEASQMDVNVIAEKMADIKFDFIICSEVVEHLARPAQAIKGISELLMPGGLLVVSTPNSGNIFSRLSRVFGLSRNKAPERSLTDEERHVTGLGHVSVKDYYQWAKLFRDLNLKLVKAHRLTLLYSYVWLEKNQFFAGLIVSLDWLLDKIHFPPQWGYGVVYILQRKV